jgi:hypothetical protein
MIGTAIDFLLKAKKLREVRFILFNAEATEIFQQELKLRFTARGH